MAAEPYPAEDHPGRIRSPHRVRAPARDLRRREILKQASWSDAPVTAGHFRTEAGDEVDLVLERDDGQVIAIEIKAGSRISGEDFRGLRQLKERLGPRLEEAIILYTGEHAYTHDEWITILPLDRLWAST